MSVNPESKKTAQVYVGFLYSFPKEKHLHLIKCVTDLPSTEECEQMTYDIDIQEEHD